MFIYCSLGLLTLLFHTSWYASVTLGSLCLTTWSTCCFHSLLWWTVLLCVVVICSSMWISLFQSLCHTGKQPVTTLRNYVSEGSNVKCLFCSRLKLQTHKDKLEHSFFVFNSADYSRDLPIYLVCCIHKTSVVFRFISVSLLKREMIFGFFQASWKKAVF